MAEYSFEQYMDALDGAGPNLKEIILDRASMDENIHLLELVELVKAAYPEQA